ncbi:hypothetical protein AXG55_05445 [Silvanigrella aquatica]|uniref:DUF2797 domain-containing protein n=1 Tax=Silvanigrella aquatica TaxID=1915309 RepID=A0A1L4D4F4_9BACT|nr:hypothetical protein AXG55_05445 [Silvanigrella aquatica]
MTELLPFSPKDLENKVTFNRDHVIINLQYKINNNTEIILGSKIKIKHLNTFQCVSCKKTVKKLFDSFCFPCFKRKASADTCIMSPHLCHYMKGTCREPQWGDEFCYQPHYVYLSFTDKYKVGITRHSQVPTRWIDQGATSAALLARVTSRHQAGVLEHALKEILHDKSHWLNMLKKGNDRPSYDEFNQKVTEVQNWLKSKVKESNKELIVTTPPHLNLSNEIKLIENPVIVAIQFNLNENNANAKYKSINLDKNPEIEGVITGIKGQYLFFGEQVFNMRRHEGYVVNMEITTF